MYTIQKDVHTALIHLNGENSYSCTQSINLFKRKLNERPITESHHPLTHLHTSLNVPSMFHYKKSSAVILFMVCRGSFLQQLLMSCVNACVYDENHYYVMKLYELQYSISFCKDEVNSNHNMQFSHYVLLRVKLTPMSPHVE